MIHTYPPVKMEPTEFSETSAFIIQTPGKYQEENTPYLQHGESLKTTINQVCFKTGPAATISNSRGLLEGSLARLFVL
jgi:hypothetical protein